jgi:hypothetical protein
MKARGLILLLIVVLAAGAAYWYLRPDGATQGTSATNVPTGSPTAGASTKFESKHGDVITVNAPKAGATITSPLKVSGIVPGLWSFEASFGVEILDANRKRVTEGYATVTGDWMTEDPVEFTASVPFKKPTTDTGLLVLHKANPSGDESHEDSIEIPVKFGG